VTLNVSLKVLWETLYQNFFIYTACRQPLILIISSHTLSKLLWEQTMMHPLFWITSLDSHFLKPNGKRLKICLQSYEIETKVSVTNNMLFMICEHKPWKLFTMLVYDKENYLTKTNNMHCSVLSMCFCSDSFMWNNLWPILAWIVHKFKKLIPTYSNVQNICMLLIYSLVDV
jgi:hypothetical protein